MDNKTRVKSHRDFILLLNDIQKYVVYDTEMLEIIFGSIRVSKLCYIFHVEYPENKLGK